MPDRPQGVWVPDESYAQVMTIPVVYVPSSGPHTDTQEPETTAPNDIVYGIWCRFLVPKLHPPNPSQDTQHTSNPPLSPGSSIFTYLANELAALYAHLTDKDLLKIKRYVASTMIGETGKESSKLGEFLLKNSDSIASKFFLPVLQHAIDEPSYRFLRWQQLSNEKVYTHFQPTFSFTQLR